MKKISIYSGEKYALSYEEKRKSGRTHVHVDFRSSSDEVAEDNTVSNYIIIYVFLISSSSSSDEIKVEVAEDFKPFILPRDLNQKPSL